MSRFRTVLGLLVALVSIVAFALPAEAHRLKLFVSVEGMTVSGYAFFIGGGRPQDVAWVGRTDAGTEVHRGRTDAEGAFAWVADRPADYVLLVDTGDGHFTEEKIPADRFAPGAPAASADAPSPAPPPVIAAPAPAEVGAATPVASVATPVAWAVVIRRRMRRAPAKR